MELKESNINKVRHLLTIGFSHTKDDEIKEEEEHDLMLQPDNFMKLWFVREFLRLKVRTIRTMHSVPWEFF